MELVRLLFGFRRRARKIDNPSIKVSHQFFNNVRDTWKEPKNGVGGDEVVA